MSYIRTTKQLGDALRAARKQLSLTQSQLALAVGVGVRLIDALGGTLQIIDLPSAAANH